MILNEYTLFSVWSVPSLPGTYIYISKLNVVQFQRMSELDQTSVEKKFSWLQVSSGVFLPQILRTRPDGSTDCYVSVKMAGISLFQSLNISKAKKTLRIPIIKVAVYAYYSWVAGNWCCFCFA